MPTSSEPDLPPTIGPMAVIVEGGIVTAALAIGWAIGYPPTLAIGWNAEGLIWGTAATLPLLVLLGLCLRLPWRPLQELLRVIDELIVPLFRRVSLPEMAVIAALAGFGEEMLFRGVLQRALAGWIGGAAGIWIAWVAASILFGMVHWITRTYAVLAAIIGFYLGWLWIATGNLLVPIIAHGLYDLVALVYLVRLRNRPRRAQRNTEEDDQW